MEKRESIQTSVKKNEIEKKNAELLSSTLNDVKERYKTSEDNIGQMIQSADETFDNYKKEYKESLNVVIPEIEVMGSTVVTTKQLMNIMDYGHHLVGQDFNVNLIKQFSNAISEDQIVVAVGPNCNQVKVGDKVSIRIDDFIRRKNPNSVHSEEVTEIPVEIIDNNHYICIHENNIRYIYKNEEYHKNRTIEKQASQIKSN